MAFQCFTCSYCVIIGWTEHPFLIQHSAMSVCKIARFLSSKQVSELVWDSESEEAGASSNSIIYLGNRILCIFRQSLKYLFCLLFP